jgi:hypothetical protein
VDHQTSDPADRSIFALCSDGKTVTVNSKSLTSNASALVLWSFSDFKSDKIHLPVGMGLSGTGTDAGFIDLDSALQVLYVSAWGSSGTDYVFSIVISATKKNDFSAATVLTSHLKKPTGLSVDHLGKTTGSADLIVSSIGVPTKAGIPFNSTVVYRIDTNGEKIGRQTIFFTKQYPFMDIVLDFRSGNLVGTMNTLSTDPFFDQNTAQLFSSAQYCRKDNQLGFTQYEINGTDKCCATAVGGHLTISPGEHLLSTVIA